LKTAATKEPRRVSLAALGTGPAIRETEKALEALIAARRPVLILGEAGTGHDVAARALQLTGAPFVALGEAVRCDLSDFPTVQRWLGGMKQLGSWAKVNATFDGFAASMKDAQFVPL
jgi:thiamine pyrophosphate-dependent acetolactate synthase large subunit-like protein